MKLKKGSAAAKAYMAKIRAKRKTKTKISGPKKATFKPSFKKKAAKKKAAKKMTSIHKDTASHNVRISVVSGYLSLTIAQKKLYGKLVKKYNDEGWAKIASFDEFMKAQISASDRKKKYAYANTLRTIFEFAQNDY